VKTLAAIIAVVCAGCATATYTPTAVCNGSGGSIRVLPAAPPDGAYRVCGSVNIAAGGLATYDAAIDAARAEAAKFGANAIIVIRRPDAECSFQKTCVREGTALAVQLR
jgi:hypothetical protein